uniref:OB domain-containing protein n=1 Tax=Rhabditophanes sp. KR3021 TaxID=114890 RepID=A0AC35TKM3_9BILA
MPSFKIKGKCCYKGEIRSNKIRGEATNILDFVLKDTCGNSIQLSAFADKIARYKEKVMEDEIYVVKGTGSCFLEIRPQFSQGTHKYYISLREICTFVEDKDAVVDDIGIIPDRQDTNVARLSEIVNDVAIANNDNTGKIPDKQDMDSIEVRKLADKSYVGTITATHYQSL